MWRFYGYYGGLNVVGDFHNYGQYADDSSFNVIPAWHNKMQAIAYEDHLYTRTSHYSYEINDNNLRLYPIPNSIGKQWIRRFCLALSKETLGQIRGKFGGVVPIPGESVTLNASDLLSQAKDEQNALRDELKAQLDEMTYPKLTEQDKGMIDNSATILERVPLKIFVG
jgi:hypothetical protein